MISSFNFSSGDCLFAPIVFSSQGEGRTIGPYPSYVTYGMWQGIINFTRISSDVSSKFVPFFILWVALKCSHKTSRRRHVG